MKKKRRRERKKRRKKNHINPTKNFFKEKSYKDKSETKTQKPFLGLSFFQVIHIAAAAAAIVAVKVVLVVVAVVLVVADVVRPTLSVASPDFGRRR